MPLGEFVDLYVRLRHPHHYDPSSWPIALWAGFLWPLPIALYTLWRRTGDGARRTWQGLIFVLALQAVALLGAGVWYVSESLVQMSLYRFSIFAQLLACIGVGVLLVERARNRRAPATIAGGVCVGMIAVCVARGPFFGAFVMPGDDAEYLSVCDWAREHTPADAVFLVPPGEWSMRLRGGRAIVVNFKAVPQLSGELPEWRDRLRGVLALHDLRSLPRGYRQTMRAIDERYGSLTDEDLLAAARAYDARYIVVPRPLGPHDGLHLDFSSPTARYFVYDRAPREEPGP